MFSWFRPRCPIDLLSKVWVEYRLRFLIDRIGAAEIRRYPLLIPTANDLPEIAPAQDGHIEDLLCRLCEQLRIDRQGIDLQVIDILPMMANSHHALGTHTPNSRTIWLRRDLLSKPAHMLSALIRELLHDRLQGEGILRGDKNDHEQMTDLSACLFGCGIPLANSTLTVESETTRTYSPMQIWQTGYLTSLEFGDALAVLHWWRGDEDIPDWVKLLRLDAQETFTRGLQFLRDSGDCWLSPLGSTNSLLVSRKSRLKKSQTDTERLGALWAIVAAGVRVDPEDVLPLLRHREASIRLATCEALYRTPPQPEIRDELFSATSDEYGAVRAAAIAAFLRCFSDDSSATRVVVQGLADPSEDAVRSTLFALTESRVWNLVIQDNLLTSMTRSLERVSGVEVTEYLRVLMLHIPSLEKSLRIRFSGPSNRSELATILSSLRMLLEENPSESPDSQTRCTPC